ncbi:class I SAM-dependent DNA methyltransferase [Vibrio sp. VB16]|uniref:class I SAM-dependent DNA methyltransferase n=1 Tax=Vibrio sp. VB16 TaxID=2785746 RepID=UPI00189D94AD|nr:class I SAM-dependent methyltransferase [Vibrio sp. VB16]UGA56890.1 class I SAM-dependent methyltransferase [Vibrio sp. VB16]
MMSDYFDSVAHTWDSNPLKVDRAKTTANKIKELNFNSTNSIVDFGSGTGLLGVQLIDTFNHIVLADASRQMIEIAKEKIISANLNNIEIQHIERLSQLESKHSAITTLMTLHHIADVSLFFSDAFNTLEDNGMLIIADLYAEDGSFHQHNPSFSGHNGFDVQALTNIAENIGFQILKIEHYYEVWHENYAGENCPYPLFFFVAKKQS